MHYVYCCRALAAYFFTTRNIKAFEKQQEQAKKRRRDAETKIEAPEMPPIAYEPEDGEHVYTCWFLLPRDPAIGSLLQPGSELTLHTPMGKMHTGIVADVKRFQRYRVGTVTLVVDTHSST